jgi:hypothetical protein
MGLAVFIVRVEEWTKGLRSELIVYGQSTGFTPPPAVAKIIPQIAVGSFDPNSSYRTVIQVVNTGTGTVTLSGGLYTPTGAPSSLQLTTNLTSPTQIDHATLVAGSLALQAGRVLVLTADTAATPTINWARLVTNGGTTSISAYFEIRGAVTNALLSRVGVAASPSDMTRFVIPRVRIFPTADVGFAIVNTSTTANASVTATLKDANNNTIATKTEAFTPGKHIAIFPGQFFNLTSEPSGTSFHYIVFESTAPTMAATALAVEGASLASFPVEKLQ